MNHSLNQFQHPYDSESKLIEGYINTELCGDRALEAMRDLLSSDHFKSSGMKVVTSGQHKPLTEDEVSELRGYLVRGDINHITEGEYIVVYATNVEPIHLFVGKAYHVIRPENENDNRISDVIDALNTHPQSTIPAIAFVFSFLNWFGQNERNTHEPLTYKVPFVKNMNRNLVTALLTRAYVQYISNDLFVMNFSFTLGGSFEMRVAGFGDVTVTPVNDAPNSHGYLKQELSRLPLSGYTSAMAFLHKNVLTISHETKSLNDTFLATPYATHVSSSINSYINQALNRNDSDQALMVMRGKLMAIAEDLEVLNSGKLLIDHLSKYFESVHESLTRVDAEHEVSDGSDVMLKHLLADSDILLETIKVVMADELVPVSRKLQVITILDRTLTAPMDELTASTLLAKFLSCALDISLICSELDIKKPTLNRGKPKRWWNKLFNFSN